jgi:hypothetical protein
MPLFGRDQRVVKVASSVPVDALGDFDCLGAIDGGRSYKNLLPASISLELEGRTFQFLHLLEILAIKKRAGRPKDLAAIPYIESTIDEIERQT